MTDLLLVGILLKWMRGRCLVRLGIDPHLLRFPKVSRE